MAPYLVITTGSLIVAEAGLSFLGLGIPPPHPSWGAMISEGQPELGRNLALVLVPTFLLIITVYMLNVVGDRARSHFDIGGAELSKTPQHAPALGGLVG